MVKRTIVISLLIVFLAPWPEVAEVVAGPGPPQPQEITGYPWVFNIEITGVPNSSIAFVHNLGDEIANVQAQFLYMDGEKQEILQERVPPHGIRSIKAPIGFVGALFLWADQPITSILHWILRVSEQTFKVGVKGILFKYRSI